MLYQTMGGMAVLPDAAPLVLQNIYSITAGQLAGRSNITNYSGYTVVSKIPSSLFTGPFGSAVAATLLSGTTGNLVLNNVYIGNPATSGNAYDFDGSQVALTFNGLAAVTIPALRSQTSDMASFAPTSPNVLIAFNIGSSSTIPKISAVTGATSYYKASSQTAGTSAKAPGFSVWNNTLFNLDFIQAA